MHDVILEVVRKVFAKMPKLPIWCGKEKAMYSLQPSEGITQVGEADHIHIHVIESSHLSRSESTCYRSTKSSRCLLGVMGWLVPHSCV